MSNGSVVAKNFRELMRAKEEEETEIAIICSTSPYSREEVLSIASLMADREGITMIDALYKIKSKIK